MPKQKNDKEQIIRAAYRVSRETGEQVQELVHSGRTPGREELDALREKMRQQLTPESALLAFDALVDALVPASEKSPDCGDRER